MTDTTLPPGALAAARAAGPGAQDPVEAGLIAAAPLIRAAERERIRQLAIDCAAFYDAPCPDGVESCVHQDQPFADLLGEQP